MKTVIYIICACTFLGGLGMLLANKKVDKKTARARWIKYFSYLIIILVVFTSILFNVFFFLGIVIVLAGYFELAKAFNRKKTARLLFRVLTLLVYSIIAAAFLVVAFALTIGSNWLIYLYLQVIVFDAFCQVIGQLFGKRKLVPGISPSKTLEGFIGGSVFCIWIAVLLTGFVKISMLQGATWGAITCFSSLAGDLLASWFKRKMGIKDFSNLLPGQGGVLDRFDSLLMTGAVIYILALADLVSFTIEF